MCYEGLHPACWCTMGLASWSRMGTKRWVETCNDITSHRPSSSLAHHHQGTKSSPNKAIFKVWKKMKLSLPNIYHVCFSLNESLRNHFKIWTKDGQYIYYYMYCSKCLHKFSHIYLFIFNFGPFRNFLMASPAWRGPVWPSYATF